MLLIFSVLALSYLRLSVGISLHEAILALTGTVVQYQSCSLVRVCRFCATRNISDIQTQMVIDLLQIHRTKLHWRNFQASFFVGYWIKMTDSALVGQPPANARDLAIVKGMLVLAHLTGKWPPEKGSPPSPSWPPVNERNMDSTQMPIIVSSICAMVIVALITGTRVLSRTLQKRRALGWDDTFIIMATVC